MPNKPDARDGLQPPVIRSVRLTNKIQCHSKLPYFLVCCGESSVPLPHKVHLAAFLGSLPHSEWSSDCSFTG